MVLFSALLVGFGALLGLSIRSFIQPRMEGMTITGGAGGGMPGMPMSSPAPVAGVRAADLAAAHADVEVGRFVEAIPVYERILREDPHNLEALIHLGVSLAGTGQVERGLAELDRALGMDPDNLHALWGKAQALFDVKGDYAASIPVWERIAALVQDSPDAATARGYVLLARARLEGGRKPVPGKGSR
jgi:tetratricopeptide (TPR) repeat protein